MAWCGVLICLVCPQHLAEGAACSVLVRVCCRTLSPHNTQHLQRARRTSWCTLAVAHFVSLLLICICLYRVRVVHQHVCAAMDMQTYMCKTAAVCWRPACHADAASSSWQLVRFRWLTLGQVSWITNLVLVTRRPTLVLSFFMLSVWLTSRPRQCCCSCKSLQLPRRCIHRVLVLLVIMLHCTLVSSHNSLVTAGY